jgi:hypothetical protein
MGYRWLENPALAFDLFIFKPDAACIVRVRQTRYRIDPETIYEDPIPDVLREVRGPAVPAMAAHEDPACAPGTSGCGGDSASMILPWARSNGGGRTITRTRTPGRYPHPADPLYKGRMAGPTLSYDRFSDGGLPGRN